MNRVFTPEARTEVAAAEAAAVLHFFAHLHAVGADTTCSICSNDLPLTLENVLGRKVVQTCTICGWCRFFDPTYAGLVLVMAEGIQEAFRMAWVLPEDQQRLIQADLVTPNRHF